MVIKEALNLLEPRRDGIHLLCKILNVDLSYIYLNMDKKIDKEDLEKFRSYIRLREEGYPLQYILGSWDFMGLEFYLEEGVLIPRQDTEILVEYIIDYVKKYYRDRPIDILDLCFGSGAIGLSLAYYIENSRLVGIDIGDIPFRVGNKNKEKLKLKNIDLIQGDLFQPLQEKDKYKDFHIIGSNPPYISKEEFLGLDRQVRDYEPRLALDGGQDGLDFYRRIIPESKKYLKDKGLLILEIGASQGKSLYNMMVNEDFKDVEILKDYQGLDRVILGFNK